MHFPNDNSISDGHNQGSSLKWQKLALLALGAGLGVSEAGEAEAQDTSAQADATAVSLPSVKVHGQNSAAAPVSLNTNNTTLDIGRMPGTVRETPQIINVVPKDLIEQQRLFTLDQALANVPGITMSTGEGNGGLNGSQFRIRGQQARGDIYEDGLRDFGTYVRDTFNTESVEVVKGPSGEYFGAGNVGGVINQTLKKAHLGKSAALDQSIGSGMQYRGTADVNYQLGAHSAFRLNGMYNKQKVADRNNVRSDRYGIAADLGLGLGTSTTYHLNYQWLGSRGTPDYGVPMIGVNGIFRPITEYGLDRSTTYTRSFDRDRSDIHMLTSKLASEITKWMTLSNDTRFSHYHREYAATNPSACSGTCATNFLAGGNPALSYGAGGGVAYQQDGWGVQNISMAHAKFATGSLKHDLRAGVDINYTKDDRVMGTYVNRTNNQTIRNPYYSSPNTYITWPSTGTRIADFRDLGLFLADKVFLTNKLSVFGTLRWDSYKSTYWSAAAQSSGTQVQSSNKFSPSASAMYDITKDASVYFTFSRSFKPVGTDASSQITNQASVGDVAVNGRDLKPQRSDLFELGSKVDFFNKRLGVTAGLFQINQNNSYTYDDNGNILVGFQDAGSGRRIRGVELSATGKITQDWDVYATYAYMRGKVTNSTTAYGKQAPQLPHNTLSVWSTYNLSRLILNVGQGVLKAGGGVQYSSAYWSNEANTGRMPNNFSLNGIVSYDYGRYHVQFNANNLTNHLNYGSAFSTSRAVPLSGRTFMGNVGINF
ncbi:TonB-dependent siderophore receptor [Neokomagataea tanensis]|uniref:TonB-dependent siderophore receptor n=2 Tax=Neokomagataea TaxID=1223423 RepID=A0A4Y6V734_9PROT|nr:MULTISPECIES: TonB-dependent siderophore receptor [Neokomagataea]QDH25872.1 TonB-dependent siderophore receptor [Neokomagataea tanensis]